MCGGFFYDRINPMDNTNNKKKHLNIGIYAHVDAGKTTLSEALLYLTGAIRKSGRVDHGDTFLDTYSLERDRGITIFSKQAELDFSKDTHVTLLDTPGHADFAPEAERTMKVLDIAVLIISAADGVTSQVRVLWKLLDHYKVPTYIFVNKMDQPGTEKDTILSDIQGHLNSHIIDFTDIVSEETAADASASELIDKVLFEDDAIQEEMAVCNDRLLSDYLEKDRKVTIEDAGKLISDRALFACIFGSALKMDGVQKLINLIDVFAAKRSYPEEFGGLIYKISRDQQGSRLTWIKLTGGKLHPRENLVFAGDDKGEEKAEKVDQIRLYSGDKYELLQEAVAGQIVALTGLSLSQAGHGLGISSGSVSDLLQPIISSRLILPEGTDPFKVYQALSTISEEEPLLSVEKSAETGDISVQVMGQVQMEVLKHICMERFGFDIDFGPGTIVYKETICDTVEGVGHFEPLRHYAEVHLLLSPGEPGSGLVFDCDCPVDLLARNWQNLILTHLNEFKIRGVLTGSEITDMKITVIGGRAHDKHTEGGDFREATMRAVRQGLMMAKSVILEPVYDYEITLPQEYAGRALSDIQRMNGTNNPPDMNAQGEMVITGKVPASTLLDYASELTSYTHGHGQIVLSLSGYEPCHNAEEVIAAMNYEPERDLEQPTGSVFCSHGVGTIIPWDEVRNYMHVDTGFEFEEEEPEGENLNLARDEFGAERALKHHEATLQELDAIFEKTYGPIKPSYDARAEEERKRKAASKPAPKKYRAPREYTPENSYLLVDGYNIIYSNAELKALANQDMKSARDKLMDILSNLQGYRRDTIILVFDAYKVPGGTERIYRYNNLDVVFTKEAETADQYIERTAHQYSKTSRVTVATSDAIEQVIIYGAGAIRMSANDFWLEVKRTEDEIRDKL